MREGGGWNLDTDWFHNASRAPGADNVAAIKRELKMKLDWAYRAEAKGFSGDMAVRLLLASTPRALSRL